MRNPRRLLLLVLLAIAAYGLSYAGMVQPSEEIVWLESGDIKTYVEPGYGFDDPTDLGSRVTSVFFWPAHWLDRRLRTKTWTRPARLGRIRSNEQFRMPSSRNNPSGEAVNDPQILLWLDDERDPVKEKWQHYFPIEDPEVVWLKSYADFVGWISNHGLPAAICFDHDLGEDKSGFDAAKWLTEYCLSQEKSLPAWNIQSANPIGKENIASLLNSFERIMR